jgi:hypothetical protein
MNNPLRIPSQFAGHVARNIRLVTMRSRLIALFVLVAVMGTIMFSTTGYAKRLLNTLAPQSVDKTTTAQRPALRRSTIKPERKSRNGEKAEPRGQEPVQQGGQGVVLESQATGQEPEQESPEVARDRAPKEWRIIRAREFRGDLRQLPQVRGVVRERPEREAPEPNPGTLVPPGGISAPSQEESIPVTPGPNPPAPPPSASFEGLSFGANGNGHPPDTNGDVGPTYYIQSINTSLGIYNKTTGALIAAPNFNTFMAAGAFGNLCDTNNFGDPVVLYDSFEDRWVITDFAFTLTGGAVNNPPGAYQCFAASKSGDPVAGGWNFYSLHITDFLNDYPKFGVWPDGIYMSANMFGFPAGGAFAGARVWSLNKAQMYAGAPVVQSVSFNVPGGDFTVLPSNARLQTGTPPPGTPNYFLSTWQFLNALTVYKFHVDWNKLTLSTFTGPDTPIAASSWPNANVPNAPSLGGNNLDVLQIRAMMQNQYTNNSGVESLWASHTVRRFDINGFAAPRYYQVPVTGGTVGPNITQAATWDPDGANVIYRFMPSLAVDRAGDMALGYSTSSAGTKPAIKYAARLSTDPINTLSQTEQLLIQGLGTQTGTCGGSACIRWGDYSAMTLDPDGCTFWYTNMYYPVDGLDHHTRIGSFSLAACTPVGAGGSVQGTVTVNGTGAPISGATVSLGSRTTTTSGIGFYSFPNVPAGTYPSITASYPGYNSVTINSVVVTDGGTTTENFALTPAPTSACLTDTTQTDFQGDSITNLDLTTSPGNVTLTNAPTLDQQNTSLSNSGFGVNTTQWIGQTFLDGITGTLPKVDVNMFCSGCSGVNPPVTVEIRTTSGGLPTSTVLATTTIPGFSSGAAVYYTATFSSPPALTAGTNYAIVLRLVTPRTTGSYNATFSPGPTSYANGALVATTNSGASWFVPATGGPPATARDMGFRTYIFTGYAATGNLISSLKDANPAIGSFAQWTTLSWTASTPPNTTVTFQAAGSNNSAGPFNFVGPDGTAGTFFTVSGASLSQFNGLRYLKYKAILTTTDSAVTPTLSDVTVCFNDVSVATCTNVARSSNGATAVASSEYSANFPASGAIDGEHDGNNWGAAGAGGWNDQTRGVFPDNIQVNFNVTQTIADIDVYTLKNTPNNGSIVNDTTPATSYGIRDFNVQYWTGTAWADVPGGAVTGNTLAKRRFVFPNISTDKIRVLVNDSADHLFSRVVEIEAFTCTAVPVPPPPPTPTPTPTPCPTNVALATAGSTAVASSQYSANFPASGAIDGEHNGNNWGAAGAGGWNDQTRGVFPDDIQVNFSGSQTINAIDVYTLKNSPNNGSVVNDTTLATSYGITNFNVQYWDGGAWVTVPGGAVLGNTLAKRRFIFITPITTTQIRVVVNGSADNLFSRVVEIEAFSCGP